MRGAEEAVALGEIPAGVFTRPAFMIAKELCSAAVNSLRHEQSLRDHGDTGEVGYVLNPKFLDLIPPATRPSADSVLSPSRGGREQA